MIFKSNTSLKAQGFNRGECHNEKEIKSHQIVEYGR